MIQLVLAFCLLIASPALADQVTSPSDSLPIPSRKAPEEQPLKPVGIIPRNRCYEVLASILFNQRKKNSTWNNDHDSKHRSAMSQYGKRAHNLPPRKQPAAKRW